MDDSLLNKLRALGIKVGASTLPANSSPLKFLDFTNGSEESTIFGNCYRIDDVYPANYLQGVTELCVYPQIGMIASICGSAAASSYSTDRIVYLDTETTGLSTNAGVIPFLIGCCHVTNESVVVTQFLMQTPADEKACLCALIKYLDDVDVVVTYNGKSFDLPLLETRFALNTLTSPFSELHHIDLLFASRKVWKNTLESRRLGSIEMSILGISREADEVPGWMIPQVYYDFLRDRDPTLMRGVLYHNKMDILSLAALMNYFISNTSEMNEIHHVNPKDLFVAVAILLDSGETDTASNYLDRAIAESADFIDWSVYRRFLQHEKKLQHWDHYESLLDFAYQRGNEWAAEEIRIFYELIKNDPEKALFVTRKQLESLSEQNLSDFRRTQEESSLKKRMDRLTRKLNKSH